MNSRIGSVVIESVRPELEGGRFAIKRVAGDTFTVQADFTGNGDWKDFTKLTVPANVVTAYTFPDTFGAYWLRVVSSAETKATAQFTYE